MILYSYDNLTFFAKHSDTVLLGGRIFAGVLFLALFIASFVKKNGSRRLMKAIRYLIRVSVSAGLAITVLVGFSHINNRHRYINEDYQRYQEMYENGEVKTISGKVEDFTPATHSKSFTLDGVRFTIYSDRSYQQHRDPSENGPGLYYKYTEAYSYTTTTSTGNSGFNTNTHYVAENCVILGENQHIEIQYVEEFGQNRILVVKELSE